MGVEHSAYLYRDQNIIVVNDRRKGAECVTRNADGTLVIAGTGDKTIRCWNGGTRKAKF